MTDAGAAGEEEEEGSEGMGEPLILRIDQDDQGSVGSEDTTHFDSDEEHDGVPQQEGLYCCAICCAVQLMVAKSTWSSLS